MERKSLDEDAETSAVKEVEEGCSKDDDQVERICAICDNGGDLLCCEGECLRSFHATEEDNCESLGFSDEQVKAISNFYCKNCQYRRHQCFACGKLGSSDKNSAVAEVFRCVSGECGRFYHPSCVSKLLHHDSEAESEVLKEKIANGASFTCPFHKCCVCNQGETEEDNELRFAMCRRCPKSYHKKCLPREISFEGLEDDIIQRAWEDLMPKKRILIYCLEHEIDDDIGTPVRNHVRFPEQASELLTSRERTPVSENACRRRTSVKPVLGRDELSLATKPDSLKEQRIRDISRKPFNKTSLKVNSTPDESKTFHTVKSVAKETSNILPLDAESKRRILALMKDVSSSITLEEINKKHKPPTIHAYSSKNVVDKTITLGKVEGSVEALHAALRKLEEGCSIEDAKAVCGPGLLGQMVRWKNKLKIYLAPILHGMRYTSYGRHFTKSDKLNKIVDILHWYAQDGDMIVDFGCGANEFSFLMKKRLDEVGKKCSYKNYDIIYPKNDFNFEQRNWLTVHPNELPPGSQLIMGLNPPFGVDANLANQFINKALECKPKLIVLIVPPEAEGLDEKDPPYDLVFEDYELLAGKSFYLPGSVDVNDEQMEQWNQIPPPLYVWSRQDWTGRHKAIAQQQGHLNRGREVSHMVGNHNEMHATDFPLEDNELNGKTSMLLDSHRLQTEEPEQLQENHKEELPCANHISEGRENHENGNQKKSCSGKGKRRRSLHEISAEDKQKTKRSLPSQSQPAETPLDKGDGGFSGPRQSGEGYGGTWEDDMARKHGTNYEDPYQSKIHSSRNSEEQFTDYQRQNVDNNGYQSHNDDSPSQRSSYMVSPDPRSSPYSSVADSSYNRMCSSTSTSTMLRYAPRLDKVNHTRKNDLGPKLPSANRNSVHDRPAPRTVYRGDSLGFAPGPYRPYSQDNSAGWLNE